jgi:hypothetical protein
VIEVSDEHRQFRKAGKVAEENSEWLWDEHNPGWIYEHRNDSADPYERDVEGRPVGFKRGRGYVVRPNIQAERPGLKPFLALGAVFSTLMLVSGQPLYAGVIACITSTVYILSRSRRR